MCITLLRHVCKAIQVPAQLLSGSMVCQLLERIVLEVVSPCQNKELEHDMRKELHPLR